MIFDAWAVCKKAACKRAVYKEAVCKLIDDNGGIQEEKAPWP